MWLRASLVVKEENREEGMAWLERAVAHSEAPAAALVYLAQRLFADACNRLYLVERRAFAAAFCNCCMRLATATGK